MMRTDDQVLDDEEGEGLGLVAVAFAGAAAAQRETQHGRDDEHADHQRGRVQRGRRTG